MSSKTNNWYLVLCRGQVFPPLSSNASTRTKVMWYELIHNKEALTDFKECSLLTSCLVSFDEVELLSTWLCLYYPLGSFSVFAAHLYLPDLAYILHLPWTVASEVKVTFALSFIKSCSSCGSHSTQLRKLVLCC